MLYFFKGLIHKFNFFSKLFELLFTPCQGQCYPLRYNYPSLGIPALYSAESRRKRMHSLLLMLPVKRTLCVYSQFIDLSRQKSCTKSVSCIFVVAYGQLLWKCSQHCGDSVLQDRPENNPAGSKIENNTIELVTYPVVMKIVMKIEDSWFQLKSKHFLHIISCHRLSSFQQTKQGCQKFCICEKVI